MNEFDELVNFVLARLGTEPPATRATLYRSLAKYSARDADQKRFGKLAADCDALDAAHDQLVFDFKRRARG